MLPASGLITGTAGIITTSPAGAARTEELLWPNGTVTAASANLADVQTAYNAATNGQRILIPNGNVTWSGPLNMGAGKRVLIRAQNYTPTNLGTMTRSVTITNNSSSGLFSFTSDNDYHVGIAGIRFNEGTQTTPFVRFSGTGSKVPLMNDCAYSTQTRNGSAESIAVVVWLSLGGICWNTRFDGSAFPSGPSDVGNGVGGINVHLKSPRLWTTPSTLGSLDTNGDVNVYFENCTFYMTNTNDIDDHARVVVRNCIIDGSWWETHGFTSAFGGRQFEFYGNTFRTSLQPRNLAGKYFWSRAGHGVFFNNFVDEAPTGDYSQPFLFTCNIEAPTPNMSWGGSWPKPRQTGCGHNGSAYVSDPIYFWNNTGPRASFVGTTSDTPGANSGRDIFTSAGAKPGYSPYAADPHPFRYTP